MSILAVFALKADFWAMSRPESMKIFHASGGKGTVIGNR
jgi:hypothetical protein